MTSEASRPPQASRAPGLKTILLPILLIIAVAWAALGFLKHQLGNQSRPAGTIELKVGVTLPDIEFFRTDGGGQRLSQSGHKVLLVNFWATWCEACIEEMPSLVKLRERFAAQGLEIYGVNLDENPEKAIAATAAEFGIRFPNFTDPEGALGDLFDVHAIPLTLVIDSKRKVLEVVAGERDWMEKSFIDRLTGWLAQGSQPSR